MMTFTAFRAIFFVLGICAVIMYEARKRQGRKNPHVLLIGVSMFLLVLCLSLTQILLNLRVPGPPVLPFPAPPLP